MMNVRRAMGAASFVAAFCVATTASAHSSNLRHVEVTPHGDHLELTVRADATEAAAANGLGTSLDDDELAERAPIVTAWMTRGLEVTSDGAACPMHSTDPVLTTEGVQLSMDVDCALSDGVVLTDRDLVDDHRTMVTIEGQTTPLRADDPSLTLSERKTAAAVAATFVAEGALHLVTGYDHVLFLLSLLFAAGVIARERGRKTAAKEVAMVVTAFTVGHSITLGLAALDVVTLPGRFVETVIAASIVLAAAMNFSKPQSTVGRPWLALVFGLIHGFGFSSVLADVGLPASERVVALASFNVGIELAQLAVVLVAVPPLAWLAKRERLYRRAVMHAGSVAIAALASFWLVERALGL